jgi:DNA-3-methyladenine glycosylase I
MEKINPYCQYIRNLKENQDELNRLYHDLQYGFPLESDNELFGRLILEINQAGLSWTTILKKQENFRKAYEDFAIEKIANYNEEDVQRLLNDAGIIRNKLKIMAAIFNAKQIMTIQEEYGSFKQWLDNQNFPDLSGWTKLFKKNFHFTGGEIVREFLLSTGYLPGAHDKNCPVYRILTVNAALNKS